MRKSKNNRPYIGERGAPRGATATQTVPQLADDQQLSLTQALEIFVQAKRAERVRERTIKEYRLHIKYLIAYMQEEANVETTVANLTPELIRDYITYLLYDKTTYEGVQGRKNVRVGLSPTTVNIRLRTLKTMCRFWAAEGYARINAMETIKLVLMDEVEEVQGLSEGDISLILAAHDERHYAQWRDVTLIYLLLDTGLRITEATVLKITDINSIYLEVTVPSKVAKNRKYRDVPISREVLKRLLDLHRESVEYFGKEAVGDRIFMNAYGEYYTADSFRKRMTRLKKRLGLAKLHPNQFRHTFARDYLLNGGDLFTLQKILDHADIKTTRKYVQMDGNHIRDQHAKNTPLRKYMKRR
ncbi:tyrosine-type recombinase/integrase [Oceanobacillus neutriphilus]|uniref:Tyrosine recombinase XerD n=1 Tax=Oceanobacillus neutriphilus TaxID=531815 RepID=A0ABQ2NY43_9BACI|nr:tyrosine-type recombinase/integrase [Oceanobacillus neutriphilus]GGP13442.1 tyrosine recombinase XerD [Oceanobacillus neutriphilus]